MTVLYKRLHPDAQLPRQATPQSAGADLCACIPEGITLSPGETKSVPTGLAMALEAGYGGFIFARSGLGVRHGVVPGNCVGVIDADYRGEILVGLHNHGTDPYSISPGERIAQLVILTLPQCEAKEVSDLDDTSRGAGGFGSTGRG